MMKFLVAGVLLVASTSFAGGDGSQVLKDTMRQTLSNCDVALNINDDKTNVFKAQILSGDFKVNSLDGFHLVSVMPYPKDPSYCLFTFAK